MATIEIGSRPEAVKLYLVQGGSFTTTLESDAVWPDGIAIRLVFYKDLNDSLNTVGWDAFLDNQFAVWDLSPSSVEEIIDGEYMIVRLLYVEADGSVMVWGSGEVSVL